MLLALIELQYKGVNGFLVDVAAFLVIENKGDGGRILNFAPVLVFGKLSNCLGNTAFIVNTEGFPEV